MINEYQYKVAWCPICNQGWIEISKELGSGDLFCSCDECMSEWDHPKDIAPGTSVACAKRCVFGKACDPTEDEIAEKGWQKYIIRDMSAYQSNTEKNLVYTPQDMHTMDPMHDVYVTSMEAHGNCLIIHYDGLDEGILDRNGQPYYQFPKLTVIYRFCTYCDVFLYGARTYDQMELSDFLNYAGQVRLESYKYSIDSFQELTLDFTIYRKENSRNKCPEWHTAEICLDPEEITYSWRME